MATILLQTISLVFLLVFLTCTSSLLSHEEECLALFEFKQTLLHQNYDAGGLQKLDSSKMININNTSDHGSGSGSDCCLFDGVVCSNKGHVIGLDLSGSSLTGVINSSSTLFKLVHLQMLNLSMNNFVESQIPFEIARLWRLRILDLSKSGFSGQIPNEVSQLIQLSWLDLSWNPLKLQSPGLEFLLKNMTRLEILDLSGVHLSSSVPRFLANFSSLTSIKLVSCELQDEFPSEIFHLPKLKSLVMGKNSNLTGSLPEFHNNTLLEVLNLYSLGFNGIVPESLFNLNHLEVLTLERCYFSGRIPGSLLNLTQLTHLSLFQNEFTGLVPSLASLSKLTVLALGDNRFEIGPVYDWIYKLTDLNALNLDDMNIHHQILPYLTNLTKLSFLSMEGSFIFGHIPSSFMNLTNLESLYLQRNQLQGQISSSFLNFKSLEHLNIGYNNFSGTVSVDSFLGLNKLEFLSISNNRLSFVTTKNYTNDTVLPSLKYLGLSSCNLNEFPPFLRFQKKMSGLLLLNNNIQGLVPNWIWNNSQETLEIIGLNYNFITGFHQQPRFLPWIRLEVFIISNNHLQGRLPIPPKTMSIYDVSYNNLTGEIPPLICEAEFLQILDLSSNKMSGTLPPCLGNLNNLSVFDVKRNNFHGPMINTFSHGSLLKKIDLRENRFTGQVPKSLANCTNLEFLCLADNSLKDVFPIWLGTLPKMQVLILRTNKFYGAIQCLSSSSSQFLTLRIIDISNNQFNGELCDNIFQNWNALKSSLVGNKSSAIGSEIPFDKVTPFEFPYTMTLTNKGVKREYVKILNIFSAIDLSCNNFEGQIPQSLKDLVGLESLNLSNNHFTGGIIPSFGNLKNLESLDLSQNKLSGNVPQQLLQLSFLSILNVSFNNLDGRIPQGKQFNTFDNNSYFGNPGLCGKPLSKECDNSKVSTLLRPTISNDDESLLPSDRIDWIVILLGVGSGFVMGIVIGSLLYARYGNGDEK